MGAPESGEIPIDDADVVESASSPQIPSSPSAPGRQERTPASTIVRFVRDLPSVARYGRYELLGRLAFGGMAEIFLAREQTAAGAARTVVVKRILPHVADDEGFVQMFLGEARIAMRLAHPGIVHLYEFGEQDGTWFIAMEWVNGVSLGKLIKRARETNGVPAPIAAKVIAQVADALEHAHTAVGDDGEPLGIVHRDVSPQNVMIAYDGHVKLLDFGVAKARTATQRTDAGIVKGKLAYMAPEQCRGAEVDARADVFALGVCLYEALTGRTLYHRASDFETMKAVLEDPVPSVRAQVASVPEALDAIVQRALAKEAEARYQSAGELAEALEAWLAEQKERVTPARVSALLATLFADELARGPALQTAPRDSLVPVSGAAKSFRSGQAAAVEARPSLDRAPDPLAPTSAPTRSKLPLILGGTALVLLLGGVVGGGSAWWILHSAAAPPTTHAPPPAIHEAVVETHDPAPPPLPATPLPPRAGSARFESTPPGATVLVDDVEVPGTTPVTVDGLAAGVHGVEMRLAGHAVYTTQMDVEAGETAQVVAPLVASETHASHHPPGSLAINTRPWSKVYLGGHLLGTTPIGNAEVPSGDVALRLVDRDGETHRVHVHVEPGEHATAFFDLAAAAPATE